MKKTMSVISVILSLAMLLALLPVMGLTASADTPAEIVDLLEGKGSFDSDLNGLFTKANITHSTEDVDGDANSGSAMFKYVAGNTFESLPRMQFETGKVYTLRFMAKTNELVKDTQLALHLFAADNIELDKNSYSGDKGGVRYTNFNLTNYGTVLSDWTEFVFAFKVPDNRPYVAVNFNWRVTAATTEDDQLLYIDDMTITEHTEHVTESLDGACKVSYYDMSALTEGANSNAITVVQCPEVCTSDDLCYGLGSFDDATTGALVWAPYTDASNSAIHSEILDGYYQMTGSYVYATTKFPVVAGRNYEFSFKYKTNATGALSSDIRVNGSVNYRVANIQLYTGSAYTGHTVFTITELSDGWYEYKTILQIPAATAEAAGGSSFTFTHNPLNYTAYFDDIVLKEHTEHNRDDLTDLTGCCSSMVYSVPAKVIANGGPGWAAYGASCGVDLSLPEGTNLLGDNGNMDSQADVTLFFNNTNATYDSTENAAAQKASAALQTALKKIKPNQIYTLKFSLKSTTNLNFGISSDTGLSSNVMRWIPVGSTGGQWAEKSLTFKMPANVTTFSVRALASSAVYYLKDFSFTEHIHDDGATVDGVCETTYYYPASGNPNPPASEACGADVTHFTGAQGVLNENFRLDLSAVTSLSDALTVKLNAADFAGNILQRDDLEIDVVDGKASIAFPAKNMADEFTATLMNGEEELDTVTYSVKQYAESVIATGTEAQVAAAKAMLNYGASAQTYFNYKTDALANAGLDAADQVIDVANIAGVAQEEEEEEEVVEVNTDLFGGNGSFTGGLNGMIVKSGTAIDYVADVDANNDPNSGSMVMNATTSNVYQSWMRVQCATDTIYTLKAKVKTVNATKFSMVVHAYWSSTASKSKDAYDIRMTNLTWFSSTGDMDWTEYTISFKAPASYPYFALNLNLRPTDNGGTQSVYFDDVTLTPHSAEDHVAKDLTGACGHTYYDMSASTAGANWNTTSFPMQTCTGTAVNDDLYYGFGSFDGEVTSICGGGNNGTTLTYSTEDANGNAASGSWALTRSGSNVTPTVGVVRLDADKIYTIRMKLKFSDPDVSPAFLHYLYFSAEMPANSATYDYRFTNFAYTVKGDGWTEVTHSFKAPSTATYFGFNLNLRTDGTLYIDDLSLTAHEDAHEYVDGACVTKYYDLSDYTADAGYATLTTTVCGDKEVTPVDTYKAGITVSDDAMKSVFSGYSLVLRDSTYVRLYFTEAIDEAASTLPEGAVINNDGSAKYVELPAVKATGLDTVSELTVTTASGGTVTLTNFSTLAPAALAATKDNALAKVCTALILYAEAVNALV